MDGAATTFAQAYFHGTKAKLRAGDLVAPGHASNYGARGEAAHVYMSATLDAAVWGAELAVGEDGGRLYVVEPTGPFEDDPDLTNRRFPGNPSMSYRSAHALRVIGEVVGWIGHAPEQVAAMKAHIARLDQPGGEAKSP